MCKRAVALLGMLLFWPLLACQTSHEVNVAPVEVKPIHITIDVNVKIDKEIDDYFGDLFEKEDELRRQQQ